jgi:hypothetical protein
MRKVLILSLFAALGAVACKKKVGTASQVVTASYPTVTITSGQYFTFPVGGGPLPDVNSIIATAYDSFYHESLPVVIDASTISNLTPGLYVATVSARNRFGYKGYANVYVAITDIPDTVDISGLYLKQNSPLMPTTITKVSRGMFLTSNVAGADTGKQKNGIMPGVFALTSPSTLSLTTQRSGGAVLTTSRVISAINGTWEVASPDTTVTYILNIDGFSGTPSTFFRK